MKRCREVDIRLNPDKMNTCKSTLFGHLLNADGLNMEPDKVKENKDTIYAITNMLLSHLKIAYVLYRNAITF